MGLPQAIVARDGASISATELSEEVKADPFLIGMALAERLATLPFSITPDARTDVDLPSSGHESPHSNGGLQGECWTAVLSYSRHEGPGIPSIHGRYTLYVCLAHAILFGYETHLLN